jgi:hypothetical protein
MKLREMRVQPLTACSIVKPEHLQKLECSDRIILPKAFQQALEYKQFDLLLLTDIRKKQVHGTVFGVQDTDDLTLYIPTWMCMKLDVMENITVSQAPRRACRQIQIKPHTLRFAKDVEFVKKLNAALLNYGSLTQFTTIPLDVEGEVCFVSVECLFPESVKTCFLHDCGSVQLQTLPALESEEAPLTYLMNVKNGSGGVSGFIPFTGRGFLVGGGSAAPANPTSAAAAAAAARRRMKPHP